jgi:hypothetical protein
LKVKARLSMGLKKVIRSTVSPTSAASSLNSGNKSRLSQYEYSQLRPLSGTIINPVLAEGGRDADTTTPFREETLSRKPEIIARTPDVEMDIAVTGTRSEINFPNKSEASCAEMMFLFIKAELGEAYAALAAKAMGLELTPDLKERRYPARLRLVVFLSLLVSLLSLPTRRHRRSSAICAPCRH